MNMKKIIVVALLASLLLLTGCSGNRVRISQNSLWIDNLVLSIRNGYKIAEDAYDIMETDSGYDIVIHMVREEQEQ